MTGLEVLRTIAAGELPGAPIAELLGFGPVEADGKLLAHGTTTCLILSPNGHGA